MDAPCSIGSQKGDKNGAASKNDGVINQQAIGHFIRFRMWTKIVPASTNKS
jgi:hypothetical protein